MVHGLTFQPTDNQAFIFSETSFVCSKLLMYTANPQKVIGKYYNMMTLVVLERHIDWVTTLFM